MKRFLGRWILATCAAFGGALLPATSQAAGAPATTPTAGAPARPKVCLVLSGGGARGAAHVGVIAVLEELRVPVDCIAGTSMGALVGAAYASGMSVAEMEQALREIDTRLLFVEKPPREEQSIRAKLDDDLDLFGFELGVRDAKLLLPKGAVSGRAARDRAAATHQGQGLPALRRAADPVPRGRHRPRQRQVGRLQRGRARQRDAREHVGARGDRAGGVRRQDAGRRRPHRQPAGRRRAPDGRRHRHRRQPGDHAGAQGPAQLRRRHHRAGDQPPDRAERARLARLAQARRRADPAGARGLLGRRLRPPAADGADRRGGGAQGRRPARGSVGAAGPPTPRGRRGSAPPRSSMANGSTRSASRGSNASIPSTRCR